MLQTGGGPNGTVIKPLQGVFNHDNFRILSREIDAEQNKQDDQNRPEITHRKFNASDSWVENH